ncbi:hypothetical protein RND81_05G097700 [Saponaria officinalis]|uniref:Uncharacterized protein n=1 Tax=Saponaria officinalis TaxID=3572 RepID=A0AAW1KWN0_SAPOF
MCQVTVMDHDTGQLSFCADAQLARVVAVEVTGGPEIDFHRDRPLLSVAMYSKATSNESILRSCKGWRFLFVTC